MTPAIEELLEAGRGLATVAEEMRAHDPQTVDAALLRWIRAVVGQRNAATLFDSLVAAVRDDRSLETDTVADRIAAVIGCEYSVDALGAALEVLAGALIRAARDEATLDDEETAAETRDDIRDHRRGAS